MVPPVVPPSIGWLFPGFCLPVFTGTVVILVRNLPRNWVRCCSCGHNLPTDTHLGDAVRKVRANAADLLQQLEDQANR